MIAESEAAATSLTRHYAQIRPGRKVFGIAAALLPFDDRGAIAEDEFARHLQRTAAAGLVNAVNMDTGYANLLSDQAKQQVLKIARQALGANAPLVAGVFIEGRAGEPAELYRRGIAEVRKWGATPILFQTSALHGLAPAEKSAVYREACREGGDVIAFELGQVFAPNGEIWDVDTFRRILDIPQVVGVKHSSLSKREELKRLRIRDEHRPEFRIYTGNDLGIDMIEWGSDYLLGLATFHPAAFALRDRLWEEEDDLYLELTEALQYLGAVAFRPPVPAYKHSAAHFLRMQGLLSTSRTHPESPDRPAWEPEILRSCLERIEALL